MALPSCRRCGKQDPQRMHGLMSLWFAPLIELEADLGYFYLCPACHDEIIVPELERIQNRILELHPAAQRALDHEAVETATLREPDSSDEPEEADQADQAEEREEAEEAPASEATGAASGGEEDEGRNPDAPDNREPG